MSNLIKRCLDIMLSALGLVVLCVPFLVIMLLIRLDSPGSPIYWSSRVGRFGRIFVMPKFRSMHIDTPEVPTDELEKPAERITRIGKWLRKYSIDELPQLFSVLRGDMSVVGPRPMIPKLSYVVESRRKAGVDVLRPGITGWAQINGRDDTSIENKIALDIEYLNQRSLAFDLKIMAKTVVYVLRAKGVWH